MPLSHLTPSHLISCCFPSCGGFSQTSIPVTPELPTGRTRFCSGPAHHRYFRFCGWHFVSMNRSWKTDASIYTQNCLVAWCNSNKSCITDFQMKDPPYPHPRSWDGQSQFSLSLVSQPRTTRDSTCHPKSKHLILFSSQSGLF